MIAEQRLAKIIAADRYQLAAEIATETIESRNGMYAGDDFPLLSDRSLR